MEYSLQMTKRLLYALSSVLLLCIPWWGGPSLTLLVAFVPLLMLQRELAGQVGPRGRQRRLWPYLVLTFSLWWLVTTFWVGYAAVIGIVAATLIGTLLNTTAFLIYHAVWRRAPRPLAYTLFVTAWIAYEYLYLCGEISFPWLVLGNGFGGSVALVQWYEYTGALGGSLWVLVANLLIFESLKQWKSWRRWIAPALWVLLPAALSLAIYANYQAPQRRVTATVIQPNLEPYHTKFEMDHGQVRALLLDLVAQAPDSGSFIAAPETCLPEAPQEGNLEMSPSILAIQDFVRTQKPAQTVVCGAMTYFYYPPGKESVTARQSPQGGYYDYFNSALGIDSSGKVHIHHKSKLVAGAEKIPYYSLLKNLDFLVLDLGGISGQLGVDSVRKVFTSPDGVRYAAGVCYESIYGDYFAEFVQGGAELLFIITNDGWWRDTPGYRQHFSFARLRAIETRRSIVRSANTGISGFIDPRGDVSGRLGWDVRGTASESVGLNDRITFFVRYGDLTGRVGSFVFGLCLLYFMAYRVRRKMHVEP